MIVTTFNNLLFSLDWPYLFRCKAFWLAVQTISCLNKRSDRRLSEQTPRKHHVWTAVQTVSCLNGCSDRISSERYIIYNSARGTPIIQGKRKRNQFMYDDLGQTFSTSIRTSGSTTWVRIGKVSKFEIVGMSLWAQFRTADSCGFSRVLTGGGQKNCEIIQQQAVPSSEPS